MVVSNICTSQSYLHICVLFFIRFRKWCQIFFTHTPSARCDNWWFKTIISKFQLVKLHTIENFHSFGTSINLPNHNGTSFELGQVYWHTNLVDKFIHQKNVNFEEMQQALNEYVKYEYACKLCFSKSRVL
jgi:hypothetical protein